MFVSAVMSNQIENYRSLYKDNVIKNSSVEEDERTPDKETYENIRHWKTFCEEQISKNLDIIA